jgi:hypothetical protein
MWEMPRPYTFEMKCARQILAANQVGKGWVDPFAGKHSPAQWTNDLDPETPATAHLEAFDFLKTFSDCAVAGVVLDPPYSFRQRHECYKGRGAQIALTPVLDEAARICRVGGSAICWGWNTNGLGKKRGFELRQVYLIAHGGHHNDTLVTVECKRTTGRRMGPGRNRRERRSW